jgi:uncharacterized membrane protein
MNKAVLILSGALAIFSGIGSYFTLPVVPYVITAGVILIGLYMAWRGKNYGWVLYLLALSLIWQTSMLGIHIVGVDIHTEYYNVKTIIENGWDYSWATNGNTSIVLAWLSPALDKIGISVVWQFKLLYPALCALAPVIMYHAFKRMFGNKRAFLAGLFFAITPMFTMEVVSMVKSQVAYFALALFVYYLVRADIKLLIRVSGIVLAATLAILAHYSVGTIVLALSLAICVLSILVLIPFFRKQVGSKIPFKIIAIVFVVVSGVFLTWYSIVGGGTVVSTLKETAVNIKNVTVEVAKDDSGNVTNPDSTYLDEYLEYTSPVDHSSYLDMQSPLIRTALALDWNEVSGWGKAFRVVQYLTQIAIILGIISIFRRRKKLPAEYIILVMSGFVILLACVFIPFFTTTLSVTRFYAATLFFLAPLLVLGLSDLFPKRLIKLARWFPAIVILIYFLFTSGAVFELSKSTTTDKLDTPYSMAMSWNRLGLIGVYTANDIKACEWLTSQTDVTIPIYSDYLGACILMESKASERFVGTEPIIKYYLFLTEWNNYSKTMVNGSFGGARTWYQIPQISEAQIIYRAGNAIVLEIDK